MRSWPTDIHGDPAQEDPDWELEEASELLRSCHVLDPWLFLVFVRVVSFLLCSLPRSAVRDRGHSYFRNQRVHVSLPFSLDSSLGGDFLAGLTVACILIPQSVSYGTSLAKLDPTAGLVRLSTHFASFHLMQLILHPMICSSRHPSPEFSTLCWAHPVN